MKTENLPATSDSTSIKPTELFTQFHNPKKRAFLAAFCQSGRIVSACKDACIHWTSHYHWLRKDKTYASAFEQAKQIAADHFEDEIHRRGFEGFDRPVIYQGEIRGCYREYSDTLAIFALKGLRPEKYRESAPFVTAGPVQFNITFTHRPQNAVPIEGKSDNECGDKIL